MNSNGNNSDSNNIAASLWFWVFFSGYKMLSHAFYEITGGPEMVM